MAKVGLIGAGNMGTGMSRNILKAGHELTVYDIRPEPLEILAQEGAHIATSPREVGAAADTVFIMVLNVEQVKAALLTEDGLLAGLKPGSTIICTATIGAFTGNGGRRTGDSRRVQYCRCTRQWRGTRRSSRNLDNDGIGTK